MEEYGVESEGEQGVLDVEAADVEGVEIDEVDDSGTGAAIALLVALLSFLVAVAFIILRNVLFHA